MKIPVGASICALVACLSAASWSLVTPPFQVADEPDHLAYVQQLAETGRLPTPRAQGAYAPEELIALGDLNTAEIRKQPQTRVSASPEDQERLRRDLDAPSPRRGNGSAGLATAEPPLYYALQSLVYHLGASGTLLDRLELMRLFSALLAGFTAFFVCLFLAEALPGAPWAWTVGGLGVALVPMLGFISGAVNPDALLFALCAAAFYSLARGFRRGLTTRLAIGLGGLTALGLMSKLNFIGLLPGLALGLIVLTRRAAQSSRRDAFRCLVLASAIAAAPAILYTLVSSHLSFGVLTDGIALTHRHGSLSGELGYIWQLYLPRLPGMSPYFPGVSSTRAIWFDGLVGIFGWRDTFYPDRIYDLALIPAGIVSLLCARTLIVERGALRARAAELLVYLSMCLGLLILIGADSYLVFPKEAAGFRDTRYLLPLLALYGAVLALAARGAGRRFGPALGASMVVLALADNIWGQLLVISRYYG